MAEEIKQQDNQQLQPEAPTSNKRIAKNALMLYIRMFLTMIVGLYTSRVVLATLGVDDYGIYGVVGGVVAMMGFLNASMSGATSRFLTFELGRGDQKRLSETFSSALIVHIGIALIVFVLAETVGLWFLCNKLVIPAERMNAAHWVYQCSILSAMLGITQAPYNASIIAHEKMDIYAYVEILNVTLKLLIVYLLVIGNFDKLKLYAVLVLAVSVLIMLIYRIYCIRKFKETHFHWIWKKEILKPLLSFSGWDLYGNMAFSFRQQGTNFIINIFYGVILNAANNLAATLQGVMLGFSSNIVMAFRPPIIKAFSVDDTNSFNRLIILCAKLSTLLLMIVSIPVMIKTDFILELWLGEVPKGSVIMTQLLLGTNLFNTCSYALHIGIEATGKMKLYSIICGTLYLIVLPVMYIVLKLGAGYDSIYWIILIISIIVLIIYTSVLNINTHAFKAWLFIRATVYPLLLIFLAVFFLSKGLDLLFDSDLISIMAIAICSMLLTPFLGVFSLRKNERLLIKDKIRTILKK